VIFLRFCPAVQLPLRRPAIHRGEIDGQKSGQIGKYLKYLVPFGREKTKMKKLNIYVVPYNYSVIKEPKVLKTWQGVDEVAIEYSIRTQRKDYPDGEMAIHKGPGGEWKNYTNSDQLFYNHNVRALMTAINTEESKVGSACVS